MPKTGKPVNSTTQATRGKEAEHGSYFIFSTLLSEFRCVFTAPSFLIFLDLMTGWVLSHRHRYVTN